MSNVPTPLSDELKRQFERSERLREQLRREYHRHDDELERIIRRLESAGESQRRERSKSWFGFLLGRE